MLMALFIIQCPLLAASIRFLPWDDEIAARKIGLQNGKNVTELQGLHPHKRSSPYPGASDDAPLFLVAMDRTSEDEKPVTVPIKVPDGITSPLVLVIPDSKSPTGLRPFVIEDDASAFPWGTVRFVNATAKSLIIRHDKAVKKLTGSWKHVDVTPGGQARNVGIQLASQQDTRAILYSAVWEHDPNVRKLVFIVPGTDVRTGVVDLKIIPEDRRTVAPDEVTKAP